MRIPRIFSDQDLVCGQSVSLNAFASGHICRVLRMKPGRELVVFNGRGGEFSAVLIEADSKKAVVELRDFDPVNRESNLKTHLGLALSRGDRFDRALQKSVELGVTEITPLVCERSDRIADPKRMKRKMDHWQKLMISASEQCGRTGLAKISEPKDCRAWCTEDSAGAGYFFAPSTQSLKDSLKELKVSPEKVRLAIGPEGGFALEEEEQFLEQGFTAVSIGPRILRTETAPVAAISLFQYMFGDIS